MKGIKPMKAHPIIEAQHKLHKREKRGNSCHLHEEG